MAEQIQFETPENIEVRYDLAGLGTRFVAWFTDQLILFVLAILIFLAVVIFASSAERFLEPIGRMLPKDGPSFNNEMPLYAMGIFILVVGFGNFVYYALSELLLRGQTIGKRSVSIRVIKIDGFSIDAPSILIRSLFRVIDHVPVMWIVPVLSKKSQRLGDLAAGTCVVVDKPRQLTPLRQLLLSRPEEEIAFRFDIGLLRKLRPQDFEAVEKTLERSGQMVDADRAAIVSKLSRSLAKRMGMEMEGPEDPVLERRFLEDLLRAEYKRQSRMM